MATYAKGGKFITKFMVSGKRHARMTDTEAQGEAWELAARAALKLGKPIPEPDGGSLSVGGHDAGKMSNVLRSAEVNHWRTLRRGGTGQVKNASAFVNWVGPNTAASEAMTLPTIRKFLAEKHVSNNTKNKYISAISVLNAFSGTPKLELPWFDRDKGTARQRFFSQEEEQDVIALLHRWSRDRERDLFMFLNDTGLRPWAEALPLKWAQIKDDRLVDVEGKSGELRIVPLTKRARLVLDRQDHDLPGPWHGLNQFTLNGVWDHVRAAIPALDSDDPRWRTVWYSCRHTFASRLIQAGKPYGFVAKLMDNSVAVIEKHYGHLAPNHLKDAVSALDEFGVPQENIVSLVDKRSNG
jgi:integrase